MSLLPFNPGQPALVQVDQLENLVLAYAVTVSRVGVALLLVAVHARVAVHIDIRAMGIEIPMDAVHMDIHIASLVVIVAVHIDIVAGVVGTVLLYDPPYHKSYTFLGILDYAR